MPFSIGDKVTYTNHPDKPELTIRAIIYGRIPRPDGKFQYLLLHYAGKEDYGPYRSTVSDSTSTLMLDTNPPIIKSKWENTSPGG
jgi:hypothetical protein